MKIKKIISIFLLILIVSHGILQFMLYKVMQVKYRLDMVEQISHGIPDSYLTILKFGKSNYKMSSGNIKWIEDDEFRYQNSMYDVVKTKTVGDSIYLYCIMDENESELYTYFEKYLQNLAEEDPDKFKDIASLNIFLSQFYSSSLNTDSEIPLQLTKQNYFSLTLNPLDGEILLNTPPPRS